MPLDPILIHACALALAAILATAATHKLRAPRWFVAQLEAYALLPQGLLKPVARLLPLLEGAVALGLLLPLSRSAAALAASALMLLYAGAIAVNLWRGRRDIDCGCAGPGESQPLRPVLLLRNAVLLGLALLATATPLARELGLFDGFVAIAAAAVLLLLYAAVDGLLTNAPRLLKLTGR
ncbi:Methylamine utilization protein MauE [compost metagenome]|jgi:hypothetical protein